MKRRGAAVLGSPIAHSLSPLLHETAYRELGLRGWRYRAIECTPEQLRDTLQRLDAERLAGVSLTMPLKRAVLTLLTETDALAGEVGAVNTVLFGSREGEWRGANTDVPGMIAALELAGLDSLATTDPTWLLGVGATACSAIAAIATLGGREVVAVARDTAKAADLVKVAARFDVAVDLRPWSQAEDCVRAPLIVSTTPAGSTDSLAPAVRRVRGVLFDVVYVPWPTALASAWADAGGMVVGGLNLLVQQAVEQVRLMTGKQPSASKLRLVGDTVLKIQAAAPIG